MVAAICARTRAEGGLLRRVQRVYRAAGTTWPSRCVVWYRSGEGVCGEASVTHGEHQGCVILGRDRVQGHGWAARAGVGSSALRGPREMKARTARRRSMHDERRRK